MNTKNVKKPATKKTAMSSSKITKLGNKALESVIDIVRDMTDLSTRAVNLSQEILLGFKDYADIYLVNTTETTIEQIVRQFREEIYTKCLFLLPSQKTIAYSESKMKRLQTSDEAKDRADHVHYLKCMKEHPDIDGNSAGLPSKTLQDVFSNIAQIPRLMAFKDTTGVLEYDYSSLETMPDRVSPIRADKAAMNKVIKEKNATEKRQAELDTKLGHALVTCQNSFDNFIRLIDDCRKVITDTKGQSNVAKIGNAVSRKVDSDLFKLNVILQDQLSLPSNKEKLNSSFSVIKETSDGIMVKMDRAIKKAESKIDKIAIEVKTQKASTNK